MIYGLVRRPELITLQKIHFLDVPGRISFLRTAFIVLDSHRILNDTGVMLQHDGAHPHINVVAFLDYVTLKSAKTLRILLNYCIKLKLLKNFLMFQSILLDSCNFLFFAAFIIVLVIIFINLLEHSSLSRQEAKQKTTKLIK